MTNQKVLIRKTPFKNVENKDSSKGVVDISDVIQKMFYDSENKKIRLCHPCQTFKSHTVPQHVLDIIDIALSGKTTLSVRFWDSPESVHQENFPKHLDDFIEAVFKSNK